MPIAWNDIQQRALQFAREWEQETSEQAESKSFWDGFFHIFGVSRKRIASFEHRVKKIDGRDGYIDLLWKGQLLVEQKSRGKDLDAAFQQATDYFAGLKEYELPRYVLVSDFARFRLYDLENNTQHEFVLAALYQHVQLFGFIAGYQTNVYQEQDPVNVKAAEQMGLLHDQLLDAGYCGHELEVYLVRLVFCLFADATSIFEVNQFRDLIVNRTTEDGVVLGHWLAHVFQVLNTPRKQRGRHLDQQLAAFPYINGQLFAEPLPIASFNWEMRALLLRSFRLNWGKISPAIFGALFQSVMDTAARRQLGAHYTTEQNILKVIRPLFLDELRAEFEQIKADKPRLFAFQQRLANIKFLDPACGCGNFLVIAYRELRLLELEILRVLFGDNHSIAIAPSIGVGEFNVLCNIQQFYGIEIEEFPAQIAQLALWLMDHQMNLRISEEFGQYYVRIPLTQSVTIHHGNALQLDWCDLIQPAELSFILGNPPFVGKAYQTVEQKQDFSAVFHDVKSAGNLDYVAAWFRKATDYMRHNPAIKTAFVATNSITQGEQVGVLWSDLIQRGVNIHFAHRTFQWTSEASGKAAVHCVIIGFGLHDVAHKRLFDYATVQADPIEKPGAHINPYLIDAPTCLLESRRTPLSNVPKMIFGSMPNDGGHLLLSAQEKAELLQQEPNALQYLKRFLGAEEFINGIERWCLWLMNCPPEQLKRMPTVAHRIKKVKQHRLNSSRNATQKLAHLATLFGEIRQPESGNYLLVPRVSSETRKYIPVGYMNSDVICGDANLVIPDAALYHFGVLTSAMHMAWVRAVCGRLESRYRYSINIVYNNFPWPDPISTRQHDKISQAAQAVLDARNQYPESSLATLYDPVLMPPALIKAHQQLDRTVDAAYSKQTLQSDAERVALLFERYQQLTAPTHSRHSPIKPPPALNDKASELE
nr:DNA methyltransferase [Thiospirillum jenense]